MLFENPLNNSYQDKTSDAFKSGTEVKPQHSDQDKFELLLSRLEKLDSRLAFLEDKSVSSDSVELSNHGSPGSPLSPKGREISLLSPMSKSQISFEEGSNRLGKTLNKLFSKEKPPPPTDPITKLNFMISHLARENKQVQKALEPQYHISSTENGFTGDLTLGGVCVKTNTPNPSIRHAKARLANKFWRLLWHLLPPFLRQRILDSLPFEVDLTKEGIEPNPGPYFQVGQKGGTVTNSSNKTALAGTSWTTASVMAWLAQVKDSPVKTVIPTGSRYRIRLSYWGCGGGAVPATSRMWVLGSVGSGFITGAGNGTAECPLPTTPPFSLTTYPSSESVSTSRHYHLWEDLNGIGVPHHDLVYEETMSNPDWIVVVGLYYLAPSTGDSTYLGVVVTCGIDLWTDIPTSISATSSLPVTISGTIPVNVTNASISTNVTNASPISTTIANVPSVYVNGPNPLPVSIGTPSVNAIVTNIPHVNVDNFPPPVTHLNIDNFPPPANFPTSITLKADKKQPYPLWVSQYSPTPIDLTKYGIEPNPGPSWVDPFYDIHAIFQILFSILLVERRNIIHDWSTLNLSICRKFYEYPGPVWDLTEQGVEPNPGPTVGKQLGNIRWSYDDEMVFEYANLSREEWQEKVDSCSSADREEFDALVSRGIAFSDPLTQYILLSGLEGDEFAPELPVAESIVTNDLERDLDTIDDPTFGGKLRRPKRKTGSSGTSKGLGPTTPSKKKASGQQDISPKFKTPEEREGLYRRLARTRFATPKMGVQYLGSGGWGLDRRLVEHISKYISWWDSDHSIYSDFIRNYIISGNRDSNRRDVFLSYMNQTPEMRILSSNHIAFQAWVEWRFEPGTIDLRRCLDTSNDLGGSAAADADSHNKEMHSTNGNIQLMPHEHPIHNFASYQALFDAYEAIYLRMIGGTPEWVAIMQGDLSSEQLATWHRQRAHEVMNNIEWVDMARWRGVDADGHNQRMHAVNGNPITVLPTGNKLISVMTDLGRKDIAPEIDSMVEGNMSGKPFDPSVWAAIVDGSWGPTGVRSMQSYSKGALRPQIVTPSNSFISRTLIPNPVILTQPRNFGNGAVSGTQITWANQGTTTTQWVHVGTHRGAASSVTATLTTSELEAQVAKGTLKSDRIMASGFRPIDHLMVAQQFMGGTVYGDRIVAPCLKLALYGILMKWKGDRRSLPLMGLGGVMDPYCAITDSNVNVTLSFNIPSDAGMSSNANVPTGPGWNEACGGTACVFPWGGHMPAPVDHGSDAYTLSPNPGQGAILFHSSLRTVPVNERTGALHLTYAMLASLELPDISGAIALFALAFAPFPCALPVLQVPVGYSSGASGTHLSYQIPNGALVSLPGLSTLHVILPLKEGANAGVDTPDIALKNMAVLPKSGPIATASLGANSVLMACGGDGIGDNRYEWPLCEYLVSWLAGWAFDTAQFNALMYTLARLTGRLGDLHFALELACVLQGRLPFLEAVPRPSSGNGITPGSQWFDHRTNTPFGGTTNSAPMSSIPWAPPTMVDLTVCGTSTSWLSGLILGAFVPRSYIHDQSTTRLRLADPELLSNCRYLTLAYTMGYSVLFQMLRLPRSIWNTIYSSSDLPGVRETLKGFFAYNPIGSSEHQMPVAEDWEDLAVIHSRVCGADPARDSAGVSVHAYVNVIQNVWCTRFGLFTPSFNVPIALADVWIHSLAAQIPNVMQPFPAIMNQCHGVLVEGAKSQRISGSMLSVPLPGERLPSDLGTDQVLWVRWSETYNTRVALHASNISSAGMYTTCDWVLRSGPFSASNYSYPSNYIVCQAYSPVDIYMTNSLTTFVPTNTDAIWYRLTTANTMHHAGITDSGQQLVGGVGAGDAELFSQIMAGLVSAAMEVVKYPGHHIAPSLIIGGGLVLEKRFGKKRRDLSAAGSEEKSCGPPSGPGAGGPVGGGLTGSKTTAPGIKGDKSGGGSLPSGSLSGDISAGGGGLPPDTHGHGAQTGSGSSAITPVSGIAVTTTPTSDISTGSTVIVGSSHPSNPVTSVTTDNGNLSAMERLERGVMGVFETGAGVLSAGSGGPDSKLWMGISDIESAVTGHRA